jgi:hypothetical protein
MLKRAGIMLSVAVQLAAPSMAERGGAGIGMRTSQIARS